MRTELAVAPGGEMTLAEHLSELRTRVVRMLMAVGAGSVLGWFVYDRILAFLKEPYCRIPNAYRPAPNADCSLIATRVLEPFTLHVKVAALVGIVLATPVLFYQSWRFLTPALTPTERRYTLPILIASQLLFLVGAAFAFLIIPPGLALLISLGGPQIATLLSAGEYFSFVLWTVLGFGICFELPLFVVFLAAVGVVSARQLRQWRSYAIVLIAIIAAVVTPTVDPISMLAMAVPMWVLYEAAIVAAWFMERARRRRAHPPRAGTGRA